MRRLALSALATLLALLFLPPAAATADTYGWRWSGPIRVHDATGDPRWGVALAAHQWAASGVPIEVSPEPCTGCITVTVDSTLTYAGLAQWSVSAGIATSCRVRLLSGHAAMPWAHHIALHEIGHCLGLDHNARDRKGSVMNALASSGAALVPSSWDLRNLRGLYR